MDQVAQDMYGPPVEPIYHGDYSFNTGNLKKFSAVDYVLFAAILVASAAIGFYHAWKDRNNKNFKDFMLAGGKVSPYPVSLSLLASFMSAITLLGLPAEMYSYSTMYFWIAIGYFLCIAGSAHLYIPICYKLKVTSCYEYLERRFNRSVRTAASLISIVQMTLYTAVVLYAPSLALNAVTGFSLWGSVISVGVVCTLYTAFGGMKAVIWTSGFQVVMMVGGLLAILIKGFIVVGGFGPMWESALRTNRVIFDDFRPDPTVRHSVWSIVFGAYFTWTSIFGVNQAQVQRALSCASLKDAKIAYWLNVPGLWLILFLGCFSGLFMAAFYEHCDPIKLGFVSNGNQMMPFFVMDVLGDTTGLPGIFVAGLFSAALSTVSSGLNSISALIMEDVIKGYCIPDIRDARARRVSQFLALIVGVVCLGLTFLCAQLGDNVLQIAMSLFGMLGGPLLGLFSLGMFFPWANSKGALAGFFSSIAFIFWIGMGAYIHKIPHPKATVDYANCNFTVFDNSTMHMFLDNSTSPVEEKGWDYPLYTISYFWFSAISCFAVLIVGSLVSFCTGATQPEDLDPRYIMPLADHIFPFMFLPEAIRKPLRFGLNHEGKYDEKPGREMSTVADQQNGEATPEAVKLMGVRDNQRC